MVAAPYRIAGELSPPKREDPCVHTDTFDIGDVDVVVTWQNRVGDVKIMPLHFSGDKPKCPEKQLISVGRYSGERDRAIIHHSGDYYFNDFVKTSVARQFVTLSNDLVVPWHRVFSMEIVKRHPKSITVTWRWQEDPGA